MHELKAKLKDIDALVQQGLKNVDLPSKKTQLEELNKEIQKPDFWDDSSKAQEISQQASNLTKLIETWEGIVEECEELLGLLPEIHPEKDPESAVEFREMVANLE